MILKWLFDRLASICGLLIIWPLMVVLAILVKVKIGGGGDMRFGAYEI